MDFGTSKMIVRKEGGIGWMIFNQPEKHNAVSYDMWIAVPRIISAFAADHAAGGGVRQMTPRLRSPSIAAAS